LSSHGSVKIVRHKSIAAWRVFCRAPNKAAGSNSMLKRSILALAVCGFWLISGETHAQEQKPNIVFIMGDDIGMWNIGAYHRGLMAGRTPNIDQLAREGAIFTDYYAEASCTAGRASFITGELPIRTGLTTVGQAGATIGMRQRLPPHSRNLATPRVSSARTIWETGTSSCQPFMGSMNSGAISITSMR
jgi:Sulfatase